MSLTSPVCATPECDATSTSLEQQSHFTPHLPLEIWHEIFNFATFVPGLMDTHAPDRFGHSNRSEAWMLRQERKAMLLKKSIVFVCKSWNALATPLLYESVQLRTQTNMKMFLSTLKPTPRQNGNPRVPRGELRLAVRRLALTYGRYYSSGRYETYVMLVGQLLSLLQRLKILVIGDIRFDRWSKGSQDAFRTTVSSLSLNTLRKLDIRESYITPDYFATFISTQQRLRVLYLSVASRGNPLHLNAHIESVRLNFDTVDSILNLDPSSTSLHCTLECPEMDWPLKASQDFSQITSLEVRTTVYDTRTFNIFLCSCKRLQSLVMELQTCFQILKTASNFPHIKALGLEIHDISWYGISNDHLRSFLNVGLFTLPEVVPSIRQIRMLLNGYIDDSHTLSEVVERLSSSLLDSYGIRLDMGSI